MIKCTHCGEKRPALGSYPEVKLGEARRKRDAARGQLNEGLDPLLERKRAKAEIREMLLAGEDVRVKSSPHGGVVG